MQNRNNSPDKYIAHYKSFILILFFLTSCFFSLNAQQNLEVDLRIVYPNKALKKGMERQFKVSIVNKNNRIRVDIERNPKSKLLKRKLRQSIRANLKNFKMNVPDNHELSFLYSVNLFDYMNSNTVNLPFYTLKNIPNWNKKERYLLKRIGVSFYKIDKYNLSALGKNKIAVERFIKLYGENWFTTLSNEMNSIGRNWGSFSTIINRSSSIKIDQSFIEIDYHRNGLVRKYRFKSKVQIIPDSGKGKVYEFEWNNKGELLTSDQMIAISNAFSGNYYEKFEALSPKINAIDQLQLKPL